MKLFSDAKLHSAKKSMMRNPLTHQAFKRKYSVRSRLRTVDRLLKKRVYLLCFYLLCVYLRHEQTLFETWPLRSHSVVRRKEKLVPFIAGYNSYKRIESRD